MPCKKSKHRYAARDHVVTTCAHGSLISFSSVSRAASWRDMRLQRKAAHRSMGPEHVQSSRDRRLRADLHARSGSPVQECADDGVLTTGAAAEPSAQARPRYSTVPAADAANGAGSQGKAARSAPSGCGAPRADHTGMTPWPQSTPQHPLLAWAFNVPCALAFSRGSSHKYPPLTHIRTRFDACHASCPEPQALTVICSHCKPD